MEYHIFLSTKRTNKFGLTPVYAKITIAGKIYERASNCFILAKHWDKDFKRVKPAEPKANEINRILNDFEAKLQNLKSTSADIIEVDRALQKNSNANNTDTRILTMIDEYIKNQEKSVDKPNGITQTTFLAYQYKKRNIHDYLKENKLECMSISRFDKTESERFRQFLLKKGFGSPHINKHFKFMRTVMRFAQFEHNIQPTNFMLVKIKEEAAKPIIYLTESELEEIQKHVYLCALHQKTADMFLLQCFTGMAYCDVVKLSYSNIVKHGENFFISYGRVKTGCKGLLPLLPQVKKILDRYNGQAPILCNALYNRVLKEIAGVCNIAKNLTSHVGRKTFACMLVSKGVSMEATTKMLAKTDVQQTAKLYAEVQWQRILTEMPRFGA